MIAPLLTAWMKQENKFAAETINRAEVCAYFVITVKTGQRQIVFRRCSAMTARNDVIQLKGVRHISLMQQAIFAAMPGSVGYEWIVRIHWFSSLNVCSAR